MTGQSHSSNVYEHVVAALEAESGALRALEAASALIPAADEDLREDKAHIDRATELLRTAIAELRAAEEEHAHPGAAGFIVAVRRSRG